MNRIPETQRAFILSLHDVAPHSWPAYQSFLQELQRPASLINTLLVVPDFHRRDPAERSPAFCQAMAERQAAGDELVLHGWSHSDDGPTPKGPREWGRRRILTHEGEFSALDEAAAYARLRDGLALCRRQDWRVSGFVPPFQDVSLLIDIKLLPGTRQIKRRFQHRPIIRLALHPVDLRHPDSRGFWRRTIDALSEQRRCVSKAQWLMENERLPVSGSESL